MIDLSSRPVSARHTGTPSTAFGGPSPRRGRLLSWVVPLCTPLLKGLPYIRPRTIVEGDPVSPSAGRSSRSETRGCVTFVKASLVGEVSAKRTEGVLCAAREDSMGSAAARQTKTVEEWMLFRYFFAPEALVAAVFI